MTPDPPIPFITAALPPQLITPKAPTHKTAAFTTPSGSAPSGVSEIEIRDAMDTVECEFFHFEEKPSAPRPARSSVSARAFGSVQLANCMRAPTNLWGFWYWYSSTNVPYGFVMQLN
ncbi:hypothetical protein EDB85DRAFT_2271801 [Lactarius pseudohatsudake]|nr:hypothetical protein EDB85DRAFT_2271801 [Lactarius pseudohatsudake]